MCFRIVSFSPPRGVVKSSFPSFPSQAQLSHDRCLNGQPCSLDCEHHVTYCAQCAVKVQASTWTLPEQATSPPPGLQRGIGWGVETKWGVVRQPCLSSFPVGTWTPWPRVPTWNLSCCPFNDVQEVQLTALAVDAELKDFFWSGCRANKGKPRVKYITQSERDVDVPEPPARRVPAKYAADVHQYIAELNGGSLPYRLERGKQYTHAGSSASTLRVHVRAGSSTKTLEALQVH